MREINKSTYTIQPHKVQNIPVILRDEKLIPEKN